MPNPSNSLQPSNDEPAAAIQRLRKAIDRQPRDAVLHQTLGDALKKDGQLEAALDSYDRSVALNPVLAHTLARRGLTLHALQRYEAALDSFDRALAIRPNDAQSCYNRAKALRALGQLEASAASYERAIALRPDYAIAHYNLGNTFKDLKRLDAAVRSYERAIACDPSDADSYWNKAIALLLDGRLTEGLALYEWRWKTPKAKRSTREFGGPLWLGDEPLQGKTILLHCEQGLGDTLQFCRYARLVEALGARVILEVQTPLVGLLASLGGGLQIVAKGAATPEHDYHCPLLSLPLALGTRTHSIPCAPSYLHANARKRTAWSVRLGTAEKPRIGLAWSGNTSHKDDGRRSVRLADLIPRLPTRFQYVSLQKDLREHDRAYLAEHPTVLHVGDELTDFDDTAALCTQMACVVSVDTSVAHLSAALGIPTWVMLPYLPDWRWQLNRTDTPWYPGMKLYRQPEWDDWGRVFDAVRTDLEQLCGRA